MLTRLVAAAAAGLAFSACLVSPAVAADGPVDVNPITRPGGGGAGGGADVDVGVGSPGHGGSGAEPVADTPRRRGGDSACSYLGQAVDCTSSQWGSWYPALSCWIRLMQPQPAMTDEVWGGHDGGAVYWCQPPSAGGRSPGGGHSIWLPPSATEDLVDPVVLAERAVERMRLVGAKVGATPLTGEGIVGLQTWLWVANDQAQSMGPISRTATAGSVSVRATARVTQVDWAMGNGDVKICSGPGTPWRNGDGGRDSPTCGYAYLRDSGDEPGDAYRITPTTHWRVDWTGAGQSGVITFTIGGASRDLPVVELQAVRVT